MRWTTLLLAAALTAWAPTAQPAQPVDLALVLLTDVSQSMDNDEYAMVKEGYRAAFADPEVIAAIQNTGGVAVAYVEFSGAREIALVKGWDVITDARSAQAFGEAIAAAPRTAAGETALAASLRQATLLLEDSGFATARRIIDVASDHPHDGGRSATARDAAVEAGITINALPIISNDPIGTFDGRMTYATAQWGLGGIAGFYNLNVIGGPGSFLVEANGIAAFGEALKRKLLLELIASR
jgi:hypothetical protein